MDLQHVTTIHQRDDDTLSVYVQTDGFKPGQEVEVSVYLTQGSNYATFNAKERIPSDPDKPDQTLPLRVELPATKLEAREPVTVVTRITDVWPTVLRPNSNMRVSMGEYMDQAPKAVWTYQDTEGKGSGDQGSPASTPTQQ
jgi:hypothetical protein